MSTAHTPEPVAVKRVAINAPRLWGGGLATAVVAALVAVVGVLVCRDLLQVKLVEPPLLPVSDSFALNYAVTAFVGGFGGDRPRSPAFGGHTATSGVLWLDRWSRHGRHDGVAVRLGGSIEGKICAALINMVIGLCIASLLSAVLSRTVVDAERSWQRS